MRWLRRFFHIPEHVIRIQVDGEPAGEVNFDSLMAMAGLFKNAPGLEASLMADFCDTLDKLEKLPGNAHEERIICAQKACDLWRFLRIPRTAVTQANALREAQRAEREEKPNQAPQGPTNVM